MSQTFLSANQLIRESEGNSNRFDLFEALMGSNDSVPLDGSGIFSLIKTDRFKELLSTLQESQVLKGQMEEKCHSLNLSNIQLSKEVSLCRDEMRIFKENQGKFQSAIKKTGQLLRSSQQRIIDLEREVREHRARPVVLQNNNRLPPYQVKPMMSSVTVQTGWLGQDNQQNIMIEEEAKNEDLAPQQRLLSVLNKRIEQFERQLRGKIRKLQEDQSLLDHWQEEKEEFKRQNQRLKGLLEVRNLEDQKLRIWQESIQNMVQKVEISINSNSLKERGGGEEEERWKKEAMEKGRMAELKLRMREAEQAMGVVEGEEEGPVGVLVRLSHKVRGIVRDMLAQSSIEG